MKKHNLAFIDLETTGLDPHRHEIIEMACVITKPLVLGREAEVLEEWSVKVRPQHLATAEAEALRINGYNEADWLFAVDLPQAVKTLMTKADGCIMVGQNVSFDWSFLSRALLATGIANQLHYAKLDLISMVFAKCYHLDKPERFNLWSLAQHFGVKNEQAHTALSDARATFEIYQKLLAC